MTAATRTQLPGRYPSGQRERPVKSLRKLRWFESSPAHWCCTTEFLACSPLSSRARRARSSCAVGALHSGYHYVKNSDDRTYFKVPDCVEALRRGRGLRPRPPRVSTTTRARSPASTAGPSASTRSPKPSIDAPRPGRTSPDRPRGWCRTSLQDESDAMSLIDAAQPLLRDRRGRDRRRRRGARLRADRARRRLPRRPPRGVGWRSTTKGTEVTFDQIAAGRPGDEQGVRLHRVRAASECYSRTTTQIDRIVDSWTVRE